MRQINGEQVCMPFGQFAVAVSAGLGTLILIALIVFACNLTRLHSHKSLSTCSYPFQSEQQSTRSYFDGSTCPRDS